MLSLVRPTSAWERSLVTIYTLDSVFSIFSSWAPRWLVVRTYRCVRTGMGICMLLLVQTCGRFFAELRDAARSTVASRG